ncbi:hypothetical protein BCLUESOX_229 [bacterium endosymbiont of Bathymodiolus sp. 5 South]|nr:hypothetical protein BCLUESOX_229 [bacterium endosymbiont of Bathymodiolus sp. 5 South]VVH55090.1 hypothetical protein BSPCLSOX_2748 [uncultured Gammaproteobacteria bacterium]VVH62298.1 hypothetical protein BSPWISOX_800 [uncultured Gammaproteobacteria bacterium]
MKISSTSDTLVIGESAQLHVTISPNDASNKKFSWEVDDKVSINQSTGEVTALKAGLSTIRAIAHNGIVVDEFEMLITDPHAVIFNKKSYKMILSEKTGRVWLDRNLGASEACKTLTDLNCYGDYYQWGRGKDGHQAMFPRRVGTLANSITPNNANFITNPGSETTDWVAHSVDDSGDSRTLAWSDTGVNDICPKGYSVPTFEELDHEYQRSTYTKLGFEKLGSEKHNSVFDTSNGSLPLAGFRDNRGIIRHIKTNRDKSFYWTRSVGDDNTKSIALALSNTDVQFSLDIVRTRGLQVRCIKDVSGPPIITPSVNKLHAYFGVNITPITFVNFGAPVTRWSIDGLPAGLKMNYTTGIISGTPIKLQPETLYTVTASNDFGVSSTVIRIAVMSVPVPVTSIQLTHNTKRLNDKNVLQIGEVVQISAGFTPNNATIQKVSWLLNSKNATIHTSKEGITTLKGVSEGAVVLSATSLDGSNVVSRLTIHVVDKAIVFNGRTYNTVTSPTTGRVWLDRNLDADRVCGSAIDPVCFGGLYQFGRSADGHQERSNGNSGLARTVTSNRASTITPSNDTIYGISSSIYDWTSADTKGYVRSNKLDSICPVGFSVPTMQEFKDEKIGLKATFDNFLKLPLAGKLDRANGNITNTRSSGRYWTSALVYDPKPEFITVTYHHWYNLWIATHDRIAVQIALRANSLSFTNARDSVSFEQDLPNHGLSVRCIKFKPAPPLPDWMIDWIALGKVILGIP